VLGHLLLLPLLLSWDVFVFLFLVSHWYPLPLWWEGDDPWGVRGLEEKEGGN